MSYTLIQNRRAKHHAVAGKIVLQVRKDGSLAIDRPRHAVQEIKHRPFRILAPEPGLGRVKAVLAQVDEGDADVGRQVAVAELASRPDADVERFFAEILLEKE
ncbi:hypothetical protein MMC31_004866 [Peltigera leucophlebia]|nr:hypothetical protein [Peltigera leucophlebia]